MMEHPPELDLGHRVLEPRDVVDDRSDRRVVALGARDRVEIPAVVEAALDAGECVDDAVERLLLAAELLRPRRVVPDLRILELALDRGKPRRLQIEVKDTSGAGSCAPRGPRCRSRSR
jgi:hypothetical protein